MIETRCAHIMLNIWHVLLALGKCGVESDLQIIDQRLFWKRETQDGCERSGVDIDSLECLFQYIIGLPSQLSVTCDKDGVFIPAFIGA